MTFSEWSKFQKLTQIRYIYGYDGTLKNNLFGIKDSRTGNIDRVLYTAGHVIVIYHLEKKEQTYIHGTEGAKEISAITVSPKNRFLAYAEESDTGFITIWDLRAGNRDRNEFKPKKKKILVTTDSQSKKYIHLCFSTVNENRYLATITSEFKIILWEWDRNKAKASIDV